MNVKTLLCALLFPYAALAQGFAGLGTEVDGFSVPYSGYEFDFPADHGPHPDFRIEWWYLTANMTDANGTEYGLQWTLFRSALIPDVAEAQIYMGHAALTTPDAHYVSERLARGVLGNAGVTPVPFEAWIDEWQLTGDMNEMSMSAGAERFAYDVELTNDGPIIFHGEAGFSVKSAEGQASYYYSLPFLSLTGTLHLPEGNVAVTGEAWLDREWSSQPLSEDQTGWDWFSLSFDDGNKMMGFRLRQSDGSHYTSATWIGADGQTQAYPDGAFSAEPLNSFQTSGAEVPTQWQVRLPDRDVNITVSALNPDAWMDTSVPYWEGPIQIEGSHNGRGYLEMTGSE